MDIPKINHSIPVPPGNLGLPIIGETPSFILDTDFAKKRHQKYGNIFKTNILGSPTIFVRGGEANHFILTNESKYFVNSLPPSAKTLLGSWSLSQQIGSQHQERRKLLYQAFQPRILAGYVEAMEELTQRYLRKWTKLGTLTWYPELRNYTFDIACKFLIGLDFASETQLGHLFEIWSKGLFSIPLSLPWTKFSHALKSRQQLLEQLEIIIRQRQRKLNESEDALSILLQARDEKGNSLSLEEVKDQVLMLLFAGHETLTSGLASFCLLLAQHPDILRRCRTEQQKFEKTKESTSEALKQMPYLDQVLREVLRVIPPVGGGFRKVIRTCSFNGYQFPEGWNVLYEILLTHQDGSIYPQPNQFNPERQTENISKPFNYLPFGGGARECIGKEFARLEMKLFAAHLVRDYSWELLPSQNLEMILIPVPHPKDGLKVKFVKL
ncbi:cytochrome P450 [Chlorogloea sp. CCALA 695]|uniref:cytochrome P450 n=1 Tax=Chlorogloea sp. CCALA 695 TaxID=2107693 RepID=UPI000D084F04|nr:cytochrome P450 [Chlorogloea sp. CCALA 695]PSB27413.1 cytochrome P450 [Chlorogloea sp. CCALA 695]